ncbi:mCG1038413, partial [Mus musculus]
ICHLDVCGKEPLDSCGCHTADCLSFCHCTGHEGSPLLYLAKPHLVKDRVSSSDSTCTSAAGCCQNNTGDYTDGLPSNTRSDQKLLWAHQMSGAMGHQRRKNLCPQATAKLPAL